MAHYSRALYESTATGAAPARCLAPLNRGGLGKELGLTFDEDSIQKSLKFGRIPYSLAIRPGVFPPASISMTTWDFNLGGNRFPAMADTSSRGSLCCSVLQGPKGLAPQ